MDGGEDASAAESSEAGGGDGSKVMSRLWEGVGGRMNNVRMKAAKIGDQMVTCALRRWWLFVVVVMAARRRQSE